MKYCEHCGQRACHCVVRPIARRAVQAVNPGPRLVISNLESCSVAHCIKSLRALGVQLDEAVPKEG